MTDWQPNGWAGWATTPTDEPAPIVASTSATTLPWNGNPLPTRSWEESGRAPVPMPYPSPITQLSQPPFGSWDQPPPLETRTTSGEQVDPGYLRVGIVGSNKVDDEEAGAYVTYDVRVEVR